MDRHGPRGFCGKKAFNRHLLKVVYVQYVEIKHLQAAQCPTGYGASAEASKLHGRLSMSGIAAPLKNGSAKPSGKTEGDHGDVQLRSGICGATSCLVFSLMIIKLLPMTSAQIISVSPRIRGRDIHSQ
jgi:hypothetical protein